MVNGTVDKNNICSNSKPDEESVKQSRKSKVEVVSSSSSDSETPTSRKSSNSEALLETENEKTGVGIEEVGPRAMAEVPTKSSLFCSVPLNKIRSVLNNAGGKIDEDENSKLKQISRKLLCLYCDRTFVSSNLRQKHVERCHSEKQSRRLSSRKLQSQFTTTACFHCDKLPVEHSLRQLFEHLISAHSQKYFGCLFCEERFLNQLQLTDHNTKLHHSSKKQQQKFNLVNVNEGSVKSDGANKASNSNTEESWDKEPKSTKNKVKKKRETTNSKPPPRQLRNKKKVSIKASKVGLKRSKRLQAAGNKVPVRKKRTKTVETSKSAEGNSKITEKVKSSSVNPYPEFDSYYRVKKITDHSIDNLKISSLTFDDVFDKAFFNRIKCNIQENLLHHLDGKLFKNEESESRISNFEKNPPTQEVSSTASENFGCDLSLNAITPVTSILTANFGEDLESQIEYGSKPSKKKLQIRQDPVRHKYVTRRKYQASILEHKENRDLSKLDMWTQLVIKDRQQKVLNCKKSAKEMLEYTTCAEYKLKIQRNELNRILDRRGPFEDLKEEASKKAALEQLNSESYNEISEECFKEVRSLMEDLLTEIVKNCSEDEEESINVDKLVEREEYLKKEDIPELPDYLKLRRTSSVPSEEEIDKSDKIALICSSQETENYELPTNTVRYKNEMIELSGEWARSRIYVCAACGLKVSNMKLLIDHKSIYHQNSWVQHYELVGNQSELYKHLCIPGLGKVGYIEETVPCKSWLKSESRVCTKCGKVCNSLSELHRHILECGGDWTWMLARKKCKYRPFGARKKRRGLVKRIRVSNQKTDQTEKKKYKKSFEGPRQRPSDADTIQRMLANLPPKRSSRRSICMRDGFPRNRQKSPKNKKQVMKCGKIVRHKSTYNTNIETTKNSSNHKSASARQTLRSISRTLSSKILDTNSKLKVKRQLIQNINRRSPRGNSQNVSETSDQMVRNEEAGGKFQNNVKKIINNGKNKKKNDMDKVKSVLKEKVNIKSFFPVSKRKVSRNITKTTENSNSDSCQHAQNIEANEDTDTNKHKPTKNVIKVIKKSFNLHKKVKYNSKKDPNLSGNTEPIVVIEKLPQTEQTDGKSLSSPTSKKAPNKRKLRSSFRKVIDKVKKLKLDNSAPSVPSDQNKEVNIKPVNSFLGQRAREKEKLATVLVPLVEELKESPLSNLAFVQNVMDNNSPTEESLIPENIFNLQHNSEDLLQAKSPIETLPNEVKKNETNKYFSPMSAKVSHIPETTRDANKKVVELEMKNDPNKTTQNTKDHFEVKCEDDNVSQKKESLLSLLSIETTAKSDKSPLVSPILSPSLLSPKMKGKLRKPNRGLNDCIAMLTKKAFEETHKTEVVLDPVKSIEKPSCLNNTNEAHKIIRANECILKIPVIESVSQIQTEVLDLSKPKRNTEIDNIPHRNTIDSPTSRSSLLWNPVNDMLCNNQTSSIDESKIIWPISSSQIQNSTVNSSSEKAILKIPKFVEISRSNNVDNIIQGVIENYDEPVSKSETIKSYLKVPSVGLLNSVDEIIEEVVKGNSTLPSSEENFLMKMKSSVDKRSIAQRDNIVAMSTTSRTKKTTRKNKEDNTSFNKDEASMSTTNISSHSKNNSEYSNTLQEEVEELDVPQLILSSLADSNSLVKSIDMNPISVDVSECESSVKCQKDEEHDFNIKLDENKIPSNSQIADVKTLNVVPVSITLRKKTGKRIDPRKKGTTKKSIKKTDYDIKEEYLKVEKIDPKVCINNSTEIPSLLEANEPDILENKKIPANGDKIVSACPALSVTIPAIPVSLPNSEAITESSELLEEDSCKHHHLEQPSKKEFSASIEENNENKGRSIKPLQAYLCTSTDESKPEAILETFNVEKNFKSSATDSEDELPLLILKGRSKSCFKEIPETVEEAKESEITSTNADNILGPLESEEMNSGNYKKEKPKVAETIGNVTQMNKLITKEFSTENEKLSHSDSSSDKEHGEITTQNAFDKMKSSRKACNSSDSNKHQRNIKKKNKGGKLKHFSKIKMIKNSDEIIDKEEKLGNIVNTIETKNSEDCCTEICEKEKLNNVSMETTSTPEPPALIATEAIGKFEIVPKESGPDSYGNGASKNICSEQNLSLKPSDTLEASTKPKNFLVDTNVSNFRNDAKYASPLKSSKPKKKNKNKQDSIKTKLIFKFPKIILKEPVLRIPPRDNISESITTSFGHKTENTEDKSIKLILENPFSNTKVLEEKDSSISNTSEILGKPTKNENPLKTKSSNKKKSSKHKKRLLKSLARKESMCNITSDALQNAGSEEANISTFSNQSANENNINEQEHFNSSSDDPNILSELSHSTNISFDDLSGSREQHNFSSEITLKLPITLKLQPNALKKSKSKNLKRKKDKVRKSSPASNTIHIVGKTQGNGILSNSEESNILSSDTIITETKEVIEQSMTEWVKSKEYVAEKSSISKSGNDIKFETETHELVHTSTPEIPHETFMCKPQLDQEKILEYQPSNSKSLSVSSIDKVEVENEALTPIKSGRSLRSTVKITYKQSNIFALQIEDKEISDLKITEKPKYLESQNGSCNELMLIQEANKNSGEEFTHLQHEEEISPKGISDYDSFKQELKIASNKKRSNSKKTKTICQEVENQNLEESIFTTSKLTINMKDSDGYEDDRSLEDNPKLKLLEVQEVEKAVKTKQKKSRRLSKSKKVSTKNSGINSIVDTNPIGVIGISNDNERVESECLDEINIKNITLGDISDVHRTESVQENIEEEFGDSAFYSGSRISIETYEKNQIEDPALIIAGKYEDSSFSEGELVINESFESPESNIFEEYSDSDKKLEISDPEIINVMQDNIRRNLNSTLNTVEQKKSQKIRKSKKDGNSKSPKKSNTINHKFKTIEPNNQSEISTIEMNDIPLNGTPETKMDLVKCMSESTISNLKQTDVTKNTCRISSDETLLHKTKDEFEFEEDIEPLDNLKPKFKSKKTKEARSQDVVQKSISLCDEQVETTTSMLISPAVNMQNLSLDTNNGRRQRTAKSKALESINIIEKKLDQILDIELSNNEKFCVSLKHKNKVAKHKESITENKIAENDTKGIIHEDPLEDAEFREVSSATPQRKFRAAKAKAIENIKVSEMKANDIGEGSLKVNKTNITDGNDKVKKTCKLKERNSSHVESNGKNLLNNQFGQTYSVQQLTKEENKNAPAKIPLLSSESFSTLPEECSPIFNEVHKLTDENKITEMDAIHENSDIQYELNYEIFKEKKENTKVEQIKENDSIFKNCYNDETNPLIKRSKPSKSTISSHTNETKERNMEGQTNIEINSKNEIENFTKSSSVIESYSLPDSFSKGISYERDSNIYQKRKRSDNLSGDIEISKKIDEINCYDIHNIDKDNNLENKESSFSPSKKRKKPTKSDRKVHIGDMKENVVNALSEDHIVKSKIVELKELERKENSVPETERIDSLDVTLKTTADEISSILMEDKYMNVIPNPAKMNNFRENISSETGENRDEKKHCNEESKSTQILNEFSDETSKKKMNKDGICENCTTESEKASMLQIGEFIASGSKRRSKRASKVNTYNENYLAEAIFEQAASDKDKVEKKRTDDNTNSSTSGITETISNEVFPEKKLNSDELFDLLKATAPDNLIALKPVEENPSDTPHTDDNFDDEFDDILRKSQALFGEKPYKKLDDICRSDDSSSTSKLTEFQKLDESSEPNAMLQKSIQNCETTFSNSIISVSKNESKKSEELLNSQSEDLYCDICRKTFKRIDNLIKHKTTLTHIAKLSEMEAKEAQTKLSGEVQGIEDSSGSNGVTMDSKRQTESNSFSYSSNAGNNALKIAEIITEAFEKPAAHADRDFAEVVTPLIEYRRYKSLGERKSFEYEQGSPNISENVDENPYEPKISNNTGVILEKQITLLQNIVGFDCANDASTSSYHSLANSIGRDSPVSVFSSKLEDSTNLVYPNDLDLDGETGRTSKVGDFLKPPTIDDISEDSINLRNSEDVKSRKVLNRDEELFLECCSLLKSGSEVSNFSKKSNRNSLLNNVSIKMAEEPDVLESKNVNYKAIDDSSDYSTRATPLGDSFGDTSNSNTISSSWEMTKTDQPQKNQENFFNFIDNEKYLGNKEQSFYSSKFNNMVSTNAAKSFPTNNRKFTSELKIPNKAEEICNNSFPKMPTKGALKTFDGLKVSIPTNELNLENLKKKFKTKKQEINVSQKVLSDQRFLSPKTPRRKSKPVKNKPQIDDRFIFKVNKKPTLKDTEETKSNASKESITDKITDVYDFEETQDNTDVFAKPDFKSFRAKGSDIAKGEIILENNYEIQTMSSSSSSTLSGKKTNECITKKKHMIMGRIFKNAVKPKLDEEIRDIPPIDHNELVEKYVMNCTPKQEEEFKKPKMTEEEMNYLFDKLLDKPTEQPKKSGSPSKSDCKNTGMKKKLKMKCKKRQRSNSDSTDDEFGLNRIVKKRPSRKNAREEDNSINLEQELKECIGVASRKSQRKCTSGKQNVLVEYWSSDESAFETFLENHLQELSEKSDVIIPEDGSDKQEENKKLPSIPKENLSKNPTCEKNKKTKTKHRIFSKKKESRELSHEISESLVQSNRRKRTAAHPLYHWSSSSEDELQDLIEIKSMRDEPEDEYDEERPVQHGWIVGDSPKKLVTMLAQAKGKKAEPESFVKEQGKKKNSNS